MADIVEAVYAAADMRERVLGVSGNQCLPVDVLAIADKLNIKVEFTTDLPVGTDGFILKTAGDDTPKIFVNANTSEVRRRFTIAHELGHYWKKHEIDKADEFGFVDLRNERSSTGRSLAERWANSFAAELLMPADFLRLAWAANWSVQKIQSFLNVSEAALGHRLMNLHLL